MSDTKVYIAIDLGASSGRVMAGVYKDGQLSLVEVARFPTPSEAIGSYIHWNIASVFSDIKRGLQTALKTYGDAVVSVGADTWGVDYGLLDEQGELLDNPICYRDPRTGPSFKSLPKRLGRELIFRETGIQFMFFNTLYQLSAEIEAKRPAFEGADKILFLPDLLNYWLSGVMATERSIASTSQMLNPRTGTWSGRIMKELGLQPSRFCGIVESGTRLGPLKPEFTEACQAADVSVVATTGHDTASAFLALSGNAPGFAIMSSGTWSLMGLELKRPNCGAEACEAGFSNEIGYGKSVRFLKNICGLWLIEESRRQWAREGVDLDYDTIVSMAGEVEPLQRLCDPDDPRFETPGDMPRRIREYCVETGQPEPQSHAEIIRCIFDSLAMKYRYVFEQLKGFAEEPIRGLHVLGGGSRNALLNQLTADALGVPVLAGPAEATAAGNILTQMLAAGDVENVEKGREMIGRSFPSEEFSPNFDRERFASAATRFEALVCRED